MVHVFIRLFYFFPLHYDSYYYLDEAHWLVASGSFHDVLPFYRLYVTAIAILSLMFSEAVTPTIVFQCILSLAASFALYKAGKTLFSSSITGFAASLIYLLWFDLIRWNMTVMTESLCYSLLCFLLVVVVCFQNRPGDYVKVLLLAVLILFSRPTGVIVVCSVLIFLVSCHWRNLMRLNRSIKIMLLSFLVSICLTSGLFVLSQYDLVLQYSKGNIVQYMDYAIGKEVYHQSLTIDTSNLDLPDKNTSRLSQTVYFISHNQLYFIKTSLLKIIFLLTAYRPYYSWFHNMAIGCWMLAIYILFFMGIRVCNNLAIKQFSLALAVLNALTVGMSSLDWDNRFYITMAPVIILFAAGGIDVFRKLIATRFKRFAMFRSTG